MANYTTLKAAIQNVVKTNGNNEITGALLQQSLLAMINSLGGGYQFIGVATPETTPGTPDQRVFYLGSAGTYPNFGPANIPEGYLGIFYYDTQWRVSTLGFPFGDIAETDLSTALAQKLFSSGYKYNGIADPTTQPNTPDQYVFLIGGPGNYTWLNNTVIPSGSLCIITYDSMWHIADIEITDDYSERIEDLELAIYGGTKTENITNAFTFVHDGGFYIDQNIGDNFTGERLYNSGGDYAPAVNVEKYDTITITDGGSTGNRAVIVTNAQNKVVFSEQWGNHTSDHKIIANVKQLGGKYLYVSKSVGVSCDIVGVYSVVSIQDTIESLSNEVQELSGKIDGSIVPLPFTELSGKMYLATGAIYDNASSLYADVDLSAYEGKTLIVQMSNIYGISERYTGLYVGGEFVFSFAEKFYTGPVKWVIPANAHLRESHHNSSSISVYIQTFGIEETVKQSIDKVMYVSKTGSDSNEGTEGSPFLTIQKAINENASRILISGGKYYETLNLGSYSRRRIEIIKKESFKEVIIERQPTVISLNDGTLVSGSTSVYQLTNVTGIQSDMRFLIQIGVPYGDIPNDERRPEQRGKTKRMNDAIIRKVKNTISTVSEAVTEIERALSEDGRYMYYLDGTTLYFSRPQQITSTNPLVRPTDKTTLFNNVPDGMTFIVTGITTRFLEFNVDRSFNSQITDCLSELAYGPGAFTYDGSVGILFKRCEAAACCEGATGDGFNGHADSLPGYQTGDVQTKCCTCTLENCWSHDNNDDGYSDHQRSESNIIGGLFEYNGKGGIVPSYGSHCTCYDVECRHNCNGFYCAGTPDNTEGGVGTQLTCISCIADSNTNKYGQNYNGGVAEENCGFVAINAQCTIIAFNCLSTKNKIGYMTRQDGASGNGLSILYDCRAEGNTQSDWYPKSVPAITKIINGSQISY